MVLTIKLVIKISTIIFKSKLASLYVSVSVRFQRKQVCGSEGMVVGWAGTLLLCVLAIILFCHFIA